MPTGYTAGVQDGTIAEFRDFAMQCARAFGALVMMRDDPADAEIPKRFEPQTEYHDKALADARRVLAELATMTDEECAAKALDEHKNAVARWHEREATRAAHRARYEAMLARVFAWLPPSDDHKGLRDFMVQQLEESIRFDCSNSYDFPPTRLTGAAWKTEKAAKAQRDIEYHTKARAEEVERTEGRNRWVEQLRASLNGNAA